jgi:hypothetical protein
VYEVPTSFLHKLDKRSEALSEEKEENPADKTRQSHARVHFLSVAKPTLKI